MASFESGVSGYITGTAEVTVNFPIDTRGNPDVCCYQCEFFRRSNSRCGLNCAVSEYPQKYIGSKCPLKFKEDT